VRKKGLEGKGWFMKGAKGTSGPERFAEKRPTYVRRNFYLLCTCLAILLLLGAGLAYGLFVGSRAVSEKDERGLQGELRRDLAGKLLSAGLRGKAIEEYERYLAETDLPAPRRANVAFTLGKLCMEEGRYEDALRWLYQVEMLDPKTELAPEVGSKIVACLERLGRFAQAQYSLEARSGMDRAGAEEFKGEQVVAQIGKDVITKRDLDEAIEAMPEWMRPSLEDPAKKEAFLAQYVAEELLHRKAVRLELDKDPSVRKQAERALRQLMIQKVLEDEIKAKVEILDGDVELYYKAHRDRYGEKEAFKVRMIKVDETHLEGVEAALEEGEPFADLARKQSLDETTREKGGEIAEWIEEGLDPTGMGDPTRLWQALAKAGEKETTEPIRVDGVCYLFQIIAHRPPRTVPLAEVRKQVESDLYRERVEKAYQELIQQALQASEVKLYPERLHEEAPEDKQEGPSQG
jgi:parvulin-like peptidyl-prolyl isomerase